MSSRPLPAAIESLPPGRTVALLAVGFLLVANPLLVQVNTAAADRQYSYAASEVDPDPLYPHSEAVLNCNLVAVESQACAVTRRVLAEGPLRVATDAALGPSFTDYDYVSANGSLYRPAPRTEGETLVLALDRADRERVARELATPSSEAPTAVQTAVSDGEVTTTTAIPEHERFVRRNGTYYRVDFEGSTSERGGDEPPGASPAWLFALRMAGVVAGLGVVWTAGRRAD